MLIMDKLLFLETCERINSTDRRRNGIGTLGEKTLHHVVKHYLEPYEGSQEARLGGFVADIVGENGIMEIQTRQFDKLRKKLAVFLEVCRVTVVFPVAQTKWLVWIDKETGEITKKRKSPKTGCIQEIFPELYRIKDLLNHPNLRFLILMVEIEEYRYLNGWSRDRKKGSSRCDSIPVGLCDEVVIEAADGYEALLPEGLPEEFDTVAFRKASGLSVKNAGIGLNILNRTGVIERTGKRGNAYLYKTCGPREAVGGNDG
jgi:hypothetical protein